ncbi:aminomethyl-transferring glycine dehydrogenase subunit GcvPA [candidate division KSB1 bacterium]|nr:aminomethyl-transferring glycine dehydrogenase subunit GcvPA [candidate division KSB1 bacterium]
MAFIPNTEADQKLMLEKIGVTRFEDLLDNIPPQLLFDGELNLPAPLSEMEILAHLGEMAQKNKNCEEYVCFLGGGAYDHFIPAVVKHILLRSEFYTAYTPYQPEVSQGTLQAIYEYQSMICELTGMDVANASMYDGGSALAEAVLLACGHTRRARILVSKSVNPRYIQIIRTYCRGRDFQVQLIDTADGITDLNKLDDVLSPDIAGVVVQHPNFFGCLESMPEISEMTHQKGALFITSNDPVSLAVLEPPGNYGADIATGEGQSLGNALNFGGPYLGIFTATRQLIRKMPGRIVGQTVDKKGRRGFVLTLQTREQHIRREKATSNICTNQALNALAATVYMALMGKTGLLKIAQYCLQKSHYMVNKINDIDRFSLAFPQAFFKEFVVQTDLAVNELMEKFLANKIFAGIPLASYFTEYKNSFLCTVTEKRTKAEIDRYLDILREQICE